MRAFNVCQLERYSYGSFCVASKSDFVSGNCLPRQHCTRIKFFVYFHYYSGSQTVLHGDQRLHKLFSGTPWLSAQTLHFKYTVCSYMTYDTVLTVTLWCNTAANKLYWQNPFESMVKEKNQEKVLRSLQTKQFINNFQFMLWNQSIIQYFSVFE
jgi:hypothetical protein